MGGASYEWSTTVDGLSTESREKILAIVVSVKRFVSFGQQLEAAVSRVAALCTGVACVLVPFRDAAKYFSLDSMGCGFLCGDLRGRGTKACGMCGLRGEANLPGGWPAGCLFNRQSETPTERVFASSREPAKKTKLAWRFRELRYKRADQNGRERENVRKAGQRSYENESGNSA